MSVSPTRKYEAVVYGALLNSRQRTQARTASQSPSHSVTFRSFRANNRRARMTVAAPNVTVTATMISSCLLVIVLGGRSPKLTTGQLRGAISHSRTGKAQRAIM